MIIANGETGETFYTLQNRSVSTVKHYLRRKGYKVEKVAMDMSCAFKSAVRKALDKPIIVADRFQFCRYIY
ncbi:Transposase [Alteribacillus bidgolensis]|uniref:Transposase n=1 Tax=Alteribacillus bidgolensis TaxID=930129 RepID=A0A1G8PZW8_9BACI|nr:Transposase [Alteribacillus bidgolensis]